LYSAQIVAGSFLFMISAAFGFLFRRVVVCAMCCASMGFVSAETPLLTVQVGRAPSAPISLAEHADLWRWHKGTNAPVTGWQTIPDADLGPEWGNGPGGFGYSDDTAQETNECRTILSDMRGSTATNYSTVYIRKTFFVTNDPPSGAHLHLTMDYDDAFVAYLDGVEVARSTNVPGASGTEPSNGAAATSTHESSRGTSTPINPPGLYDLGPAAGRLATGSHVLAILGLNANPGTSGDFILIADLSVSGAAITDVVSGPLLSIVRSSSVVLSGTNTIPGATRVGINGDDAAFNPTAGKWSQTVNLVPGVNQLFIAALDDHGHLLRATNHLVISETNSTSLGGLSGTNTVWTRAMGSIYVTNTILVPAGGRLVIEPGTVVLMLAGSSIRATNAALAVSGTVEAPILFAPSDASSTWGGLLASGTNGQMTLQHVETVAGCAQTMTGATSLLEDCYFHDYLTSDPAIVYANGARMTTVRRCHIARCYETHYVASLMVVEDCLNEHMSYTGGPNSDGIDLDQCLPGGIIRRTTVRRGAQPNIDAVDVGDRSSGILVEDCLFNNMSDKGVSIGENSQNIKVRNCVMFQCDSGVSVKDSSTAELHDITVHDCDFGFRLYEKNAGAGGGRVTNAFNNILWGNKTTLALDGLSSLVLNYSDLQGTNWAGVGNVTTDPLFLNPATRDYRLSPSSPAQANGLEGTAMGASYPVGGIPGQPLALEVISDGSNHLALAWADDADNEEEVRIERSTDTATWQVVGSVAPNLTTFLDAGASVDTKYYYRVQAKNGSGISPYSNLASGARRAGSVVDTDNDGMADDWEIAHGLVVGVNDAAEDADRDLLSNLQEYLAGTDPQSSTSRLSLQISTPFANLVSLEFAAVSNKSYSLQTRASLLSGEWLRLQDVPSAPTNRSINLTNTFSERTRFYRLVTPQQP
jgi:hypothetical protein